MQCAHKQKCVRLKTRRGIIMMRSFPHRYITLWLAASHLPFIILGLEMLTEETQAEIHGGQFEIMYQWEILELKNVSQYNQTGRSVGADCC